jgi:hypothetical protein
MSYVPCDSGGARAVAEARGIMISQKASTVWIIGTQPVIPAV